MHVYMYILYLWGVLFHISIVFTNLSHSIAVIYTLNFKKYQNIEVIN